MSDTGDELRAQLVGFFFEEAREGLDIVEAGLVDLDVDELYEHDRDDASKTAD